MTKIAEFLLVLLPLILILGFIFIIIVSYLQAPN